MFCSLPWLRFFRAFPQLYGKCQGIPRKDGARPALFPNCVVPCMNCVVLCIFCVDCVIHVLFVCKCVLLPPGVNPIAVKYIISYIISYQIRNELSLPVYFSTVLIFRFALHVYVVSVWAFHVSRGFHKNFKHVFLFWTTHEVFNIHTSVLFR